jgi:hypothetical protein
LILTFGWEYIMTQQARLDLDNTPFIFGGLAVSKQSETLLQDAGRSTDLAPLTLLAKVAASGKLVPFTNETATDGSAHPYGVYLGPAIPSADIVAGDVENLEVLVGSAVEVDLNKLVIENSKLLTTVITVGTTDLRTVEDHLATRGIFMQDTVDISEVENS